jgi:glycosyltransferase involved in cell wall biosynthesis
MKLSVIIPTRNRSALLEKALESLLAQTLSQEDFEVIVVDNGSTDNTFDVLNSFKSRLNNIRYFLEHQPGLHAGRHKGCVEAQTDLLVYADDDIEAFPTWLQAIKESFDDAEIVLVGGKCLPKFEAEPPVWLTAMWSPNSSGERILGHLSVIDLGDDTMPVNPNHIYGCNFAIIRSVLLEAGGFHPDAMPQELIRFRGDGESYISQYVLSKGYKALYNPLASIYHWVPTNRMTNEYFCRRMFNQGVSDSYTAIRLAKYIVPEPVMTISTSLYGLLGELSRIIKSLADYMKGQGTLSSEVAALRRNFEAAYNEGYAYHQAQVKESPELLAWVLRPDYWDCQH